MKKINSLFIVDDDPITVFGIKKMLKLVVACEDIQVFENGQTALENIKKRKEFGQSIPDIIFLDINMPIMDGWDFLKEFATLDFSEKIIINIITSSIDPSDYQRWVELKPNFPHHINFKNKPICKIDDSDLEMIDMAS
ncbi:response regulator [Muricauda sp. JGD-17]|uniref:Response regulator n=1 Tax=Flagellimonas ochracea TaxID=2696472 RepID=A0A964TCT1_9FLAO|nr:response regulator [Allomuricauda ochracea]NAY92518.1 response regulator [Allomuricauda ochracea]